MQREVRGSGRAGVMEGWAAALGYRNSASTVPHWPRENAPHEQQPGAFPLAAITGRSRAPVTQRLLCPPPPLLLGVLTEGLKSSEGVSALGDKDSAGTHQSKDQWGHKRPISDPAFATQKYEARGSTNPPTLSPAARCFPIRSIPPYHLRACTAQFVGTLTIVVCCLTKCSASPLQSNARASRMLIDS